MEALDLAARVHREIEYLQRLHHPHIIKLYEVITTPTDIVVCMRYSRARCYVSYGLYMHLMRQTFINTMLKLVTEYADAELFNLVVENGRVNDDTGQ
jgi:serine/threonine protein kinase